MAQTGVLFIFFKKYLELNNKYLILCNKIYTNHILFFKHNDLEQ